jgi:hypothetical protein
MEDQHREFGTRPRQRWLAIAVVACLAAGVGFVVGDRAWTRAPAASIPLSFLQRSVPVLLEIEFTGKSTEIGRGTSGEPFRGAQGIARYTFTNWTSSPVKLAFPPARSFQFNHGVMQAEKAPPAFASKTLLLHLAPGESQSFSEPYSLAPAGDDFWRGGPGFRAFVFDAPSADSSAGSRDDYCIGTVFGRYTASIQEP